MAMTLRRGKVGGATAGIPPFASVRLTLAIARPRRADGGRLATNRVRASNHPRIGIGPKFPACVQ